jgi:hypothetical protein
MEFRWNYPITYMSNFPTQRIGEKLEILKLPKKVALHHQSLYHRALCAFPGLGGE